jgi:hypothetical protein
MLTAMTEEDWTLVLRVFAASRSRRGDKGRNDRTRCPPAELLPRATVVASLLDPDYPTSASLRMPCAIGLVDRSAK